MNFLSHYYFNRFSDDPLLVAGCVLPDLLRNADASVKIHPENEHPSVYEKTPSVWKGWQQHISVDALFHNSDSFRAHSHALRKSVEPLFSQSQVKSFFVAHIALELLIDHLLVRCHAVSVDAFYAALRLADLNNVDLFFRLTQKVSRKQTGRFMTFYEAFLRNAYLYTYKDISGICYAVVQICKRIWPLDPITEEKSKEMCTVFEEHALILDSVYMKMLASIENRLSAKNG